MSPTNWMLNEKQWGSSDNPGALLWYLEQEVSCNSSTRLARWLDRKLRLLVCHRLEEEGREDAHWDEWCRKEFSPGLFGHTVFSTIDGAKYWCGIKVGQNHPIRITRECRTNCAHMIRDLFGEPPFRFKLEMPIAEVRNTVVLGAMTIGYMADAIHDQSDWEGMGILADALEDTGVATGQSGQRLLAHLRNQDGAWCPRCQGCQNTATGQDYGPCETCGGLGKIRWNKHVKGCWALDYLIGLYSGYRDGQ